METLEDLLKKYQVISLDRCTYCGNHCFFNMEEDVMCTTCGQKRQKIGYDDMGTPMPYGTV